jgi:hypothetical protein
MPSVAITTTVKGQLSANADRKCIDWSDSSDRKWLKNHLHHCMMNDKQVTLCPLSRIID